MLPVQTRNFLIVFQAIKSMNNLGIDTKASIKHHQTHLPRGPESVRYVKLKYEMEEWL